MPIDAREVRRIAELARLELDEASVEAMRIELSAILDYVALLDEIPANDASAPPPAVASDAGLREDLAVENGTDATAHAPDARHGFFRVPGVIEG